MEGRAFTDSKRGQCGFTLIELLVAMAVLGLVVGLGVGVFLSVHTAYNKALIISRLREEGGRVMEEMSRVVKDGLELDQPGGTGTLRVKVDEESMEYQNNGNCPVVEFAWEVPINQNGRIRKAFYQKDLSPCSGVGAGAMTDTHKVSGVNVTSLEFLVSAGGEVRPDKVSIALELEQGIDAPARKEYQASITLSDVVSTRAY